MKSSPLDEGSHLVRIKASLTERELVHAFKFTKVALAKTLFLFVVELAEWSDREAAAMSESLLGALQR